jgi:hypothetical protein
VKLQRRVWRHFELRAESEGAPLEVDRPGEPDSGTLICCCRWWWKEAAAWLRGVKIGRIVYMCEWMC